jgi:hypothetical protein
MINPFKGRVVTQLSKAPKGHAATEYLIVTLALMGMWAVYEQSPQGLIQALKTWHTQFAWAMSIPW